MLLSRNWINEEFIDLSRISDDAYVAGLSRLGHRITDLQKLDGDTVLSVEPPENRPDCRSILGMARESALAFGLPFLVPESTADKDRESMFGLLECDAGDESLCFRYCVRMIDNVQPKSTPEWMAQRLRRCGFTHSGSCIDDILSYVQLEYGQKLTAYDYEAVSCAMLSVRASFPGETISLSPGEVTVLPEGTPIVADLLAPVSLCGGAQRYDSVVSSGTQRLVLEAGAFPDPASGSCSDPMLPLPALNRAGWLIEDLGCGLVLDGVEDCLNYIPPENRIPFSLGAAVEILSLPEEKIAGSLALLGIEITASQARIPPHRADLVTPEDLLRELKRIG